ncbi:hypothetical protein C7S16_6797 [Burkholderia thailandensis]|uniref:Uncharacterized protein n=1 Tax=Burkholderia thailandensis TaxID=57975 RepID=A0AAW9CRM5_BURTH|nr:hypothetical protein [Burkholderia thailandensis]
MRRIGRAADVWPRTRDGREAGADWAKIGKNQAKIGRKSGISAGGAALRTVRPDGVRGAHDGR